MRPLLYAYLVPLHGSSRRLLWRKSQAMQQAADVMHVVVHTKALLNDFGHAGASPQIGGKAGRLCAFEQDPRQLPLSSCIKRCRPTGRGSSLDTLFAAPSKGSLPAPYAASVYAELSGHLNRRQPLLQQFQCAMSPPFQLLGASRRSHG
jgi:hypothetical protein